MPAPAETRPRESLYVLLCHDAPGSAAPREAHMQGHLRYIEQQLPRIAVAGPMPGADGALVGSLLLLRAPNAAAARAWIEGDPYYRGGVWGKIEVHAFRAVAGTWMGGTTW